MSFFLRRNHVVFRPDGPFYFQKGCLEKRKAFGKRKTGAAVLGIPQDTEWKLLAIFSHADTNDDGFVSDADLHGMVGSVCCAEGDEAIFHITATVYRTAKSAISDLMNKNEEEKEDTADAKAPTGPSLDFEVSIADDGVASDVEEGMGVSWQIDFDAFLEGAVASAPFGEALKRLFEHFDRRCGRAGKKPGGRTADFEKDMVTFEGAVDIAVTLSQRERDQESRALARAVLRQQFPEQREFRFEEILAFLSAWMQASRPHWLSVSHQRSLEDFFSAIDGFHKDNMKPFKKREREKEKDAGDLLQLQLQQKEKEREQQAKEESLRADTERTKLGAASASLADQGVKGGQGKDLQKSGLVVLQKEKEKEDENSDRHAASLDLHGVAYFLDLIGIKKPWVQAALLIARTQAVRQAVLSWNDQETEIVEGRWALHDEAVDNAIEGSAEVAGKEVVDLWSGKGRITSKDLVMAARVSSRRILAADNKAPPVFILGLAGKVAKQFGEMYQLLQSSDRQLCPLLRSDSLQAVCDLLEVPYNKECRSLYHQKKSAAVARAPKATTQLGSLAASCPHMWRLAELTMAVRSLGLRKKFRMVWSPECELYRRKKRSEWKRLEGLFEALDSQRKGMLTVEDLAPVFFGLEARQGGLTTEAVQTGGATTGGYRDPVTLNCLHNWMTTFAPRLTDGQFEDDDEHLDGGAMSPGRNRSLGVGVGSSGSAPSKFSFSFWEFSTATRSGSQALRVVTALWTAFEAAARQEEREENPFAQPKANRDLQISSVTAQKTLRALGMRFSDEDFEQTVDRVAGKEALSFLPFVTLARLLGPVKWRSLLRHYLSSGERKRHLSELYDLLLARFGRKRRNPTKLQKIQTAEKLRHTVEQSARQPLTSGHAQGGMMKPLDSARPRESAAAAVRELQDDPLGATVTPAGKRRRSRLSWGNALDLALELGVVEDPKKAERRRAAGRACWSAAEVGMETFFSASEDELRGRSLSLDAFREHCERESSLFQRLFVVYILFTRLDHDSDGFVRLPDLLDWLEILCARSRMIEEFEVQVSKEISERAGTGAEKRRDEVEGRSRGVDFNDFLSASSRVPGWLTSILTDWRQLLAGDVEALQGVSSDHLEPPVRNIPVDTAYRYGDTTPLLLKEGEGILLSELLTPLEVADATELFDFFRSGNTGEGRRGRGGSARQRGPVSLSREDFERVLQVAGQGDESQAHQDKAFLCSFKVPRDVLREVRKWPTPVCVDRLTSLLGPERVQGGVMFEDFVWALFRADTLISRIRGVQVLFQLEGPVDGMISLSSLSHILSRRLRVDFTEADLDSVGVRRLKPRESHAGNTANDIPCVTFPQVLTLLSKTTARSWHDRQDATEDANGMRILADPKAARQGGGGNRSARHHLGESVAALTPEAEDEVVADLERWGLSTEVLESNTDVFALFIWLVRLQTKHSGDLTKKPLTRDQLGRRPAVAGSGSVALDLFNKSDHAVDLFVGLGQGLHAAFLIDVLFYLGFEKPYKAVKLHLESERRKLGIYVEEFGHLTQLPASPFLLLRRLWNLFKWLDKRDVERISAIDFYPLVDAFAVRRGGKQIPNAESLHAWETLRA